MEKIISILLIPTTLFLSFSTECFIFYLSWTGKSGVLQSMGVAKSWTRLSDWIELNFMLTVTIILNCTVFLHMPNTPLYSSVYYSPEAQRKTTEVFPTLVYLFLPNPHFIHHHWYKFKPKVKEMATHSNILAWRIPWMEELGGLQSTGRRVGHDWVTSLSLSLNSNEACKKQYTW